VGPHAGFPIRVAVAWQRASNSDWISYAAPRQPPETTLRGRHSDSSEIRQTSPERSTAADRSQALTLLPTGH
jgi:hypothetical protein